MGWYVPVLPVFVALGDRAVLSFHIAVDRASGLGANGAGFDQADDPVDSPLSIKRYIHSMVWSQLDQSRFRIEVLTAYKERCCLCRLVNRELLLETDGRRSTPPETPSSPRRPGD